MSNNNNNSNNQRRTIVSGASLVVGAVGVLAGLAAAEHVQAQEENRESVVQGIGRWLRENLLDMPSGGGGGGGSSRSTSASNSVFAAYRGAPRRLSHAEINILPIRRIERRPGAPDDDDAQNNTQTQTSTQTQDRGVARQTSRSAVECDEKAFCVVCREHYEGGDMLMRLPCFHEFHAECIREYLEMSENPVCPICRHPVTVNLSHYNS